MKIIQITPGAGSDFNCENCLRDNALVLELRRQGHDVIMVPLYLPLVTDGSDSSLGMPLFFGGINVYLQQKSGLFRRTPRWLDSLLDAPGLLRWVAHRAEMTKPEDLGEITLSMLRGAEGRQAKELDRLVEWLSEQERPDLVSISNALLLGLARQIKARLGVPVVCTLQDEDAFLDSLPEPYRAQAWQVVAECSREVDAFLPVSHYYAGVMRRRLDLPPERVHVVPIGLDAAGYAPAPQPPDPPAIGFLDQMSDGRGLRVLVEAFLLLRERGRVPSLRLRVAGGHTVGDRPFVEEILRRLADAGAAGEADFLGIPDRAGRQEFLRTLRVFSVPTRHPEAFGRFILEALASGVPVVQPRIGAFPEILEATGGGILVEPNNPAALAAAMEDLLLDPARARAMAEAGQQVVLERFSLKRMAAEVSRVYEAVVERRGKA